MLKYRIGVSIVRVNDNDDDDEEEEEEEEEEDDDDNDNYDDGRTKHFFVHGNLFALFKICFHSAFTELVIQGSLMVSGTRCPACSDQVK